MATSPPSRSIPPGTAAPSAPPRPPPRAGPRLLLALIEQAIGRGVRDVTLEVRMSNAAAQTMYRRFGFAPAGVRRGYYVDNAEDAMVMWAHDVDEPGEVERRARLAAEVPGRTVLDGF